MHKVVEELLGKVIVSCQAYEDTPLYGPNYMKAMAESVLVGGASGIRACWPQDIKAIREICDKPIIGIYKEFTDSDPLDTVFITPTLQRAIEIIEAGADVLGIDCTIRPTRGKKELIVLLNEIKSKYPNVAIMADIATVEEGIFIAKSGLVDIVSTTLNGYTRDSVDQKTEKPNVEIIKELKKEIDIPINGEGRIWTVEDMKLVLDAGANMVTIGTAITRPHLITERFVKANNNYR